MNQNKSKKILIISIAIMALIILIGGFVFAFVATDTFKSKKELFFKYASQMFNKEEGFINESILSYFEKQQSNPYENEGTIEAELENEDFRDKLEKINNFNISFSGKADVANSKSEQAISINYSDDVKFPLNYRQNGNNLGIQTKYIGSKYVAINNNGMEDLISKFNISNVNLESENNIEFTEDEKTQLTSTYSNIIEKQLKNENFTKISTSNSTGYKLTLKGQDLKNLFVKLLETMKSDGILLEKLKQISKLQESSNEIDEKQIDELIEQINNNTEIDQNIIEMTVYQNKGKLVQFSIQINESVKIDIVKNIGTDEIKYSLTASAYENNAEVGNIYLNAKYTGLQAMQTVNENYELGFSFENSDNGVLSKLNTSISEEKDSIDVLIVDIKSNHMLEDNESSTITAEDIEKALTSGTQESYSKMKSKKIDDSKFSITFTDTGDKFIIDNTGKIIEEPEQEEVIDTDEEDSKKIAYKYIYNNNVTFTNEVEIEELNEDNSIILNQQSDEYIANLSNAIVQRLEKVNKDQMEKIGLSENENPIIYLIPFINIYTNSADIISNSQGQLDETEISSFNQKFEMYASNNSKGATAKGLLSTILLNNTSGNDSSPKIKEINFDGQEFDVTEQNITLIKSNINVDDIYKVEFEKDENTGLIYRVVINKV